MRVLGALGIDIGFGGFRVLDLSFMGFRVQVFGGVSGCLGASGLRCRGHGMAREYRLQS